MQTVQASDSLASTFVNGRIPLKSTELARHHEVSKSLLADQASVRLVVLPASGLILQPTCGLAAQDRGELSIAEGHASRLLDFGDPHKEQAKVLLNSIRALQGSAAAATPGKYPDESR